MRATLIDIGELTTRKRTTDGFLRGKAAITRSGVFEYNAGELGLDGDPNRTIKVYRTPNTVFNNDTIDSIRGAAITLGHPDTSVSPANWSKLAVGNIVGEPAKIDTDRLGADVLIGDAGAIDKIESGTAELSIGYTFAFEPVTDTRLGYDYATIGALDINHVALVKHGRAGTGVRVFDSTPNPNPETSPMTEAEIRKLIQTTLSDALPTPAAGATGTPAPIDVGRLASAVTEQMKPVLDEVKKLADEAAKQKQESLAAEAKEKAQKATDEYKTAIIKDERVRAMVVADALPLIPEADREKLATADLKDILLAAIGDAIPIPEGSSDDYIRGAFDTLKRDRSAARQPHQLSKGGKTANATDAETAREEMIKRLADSHTLGNPPVNPTLQPAAGA